MSITKETVEHVAQVARLHLSEEEKQRFTKELQEVFELFSGLQSIDTTEVDPAFHAIETDKHLREDKVEPSLTQEQALSNTSHKEDDYFKGPRIL
jgi:aspartyl-tRNA(Asn)/glutamyl-tRNA(Gln) amidotransferase subunit C